MAVLLGALWCLNLAGQTAGGASGTIEGRILNPVTGDYLLNARVSVAGTDHVALTDATGAYRLAGVPAGNVTLRVAQPGLDEQQRDVEVKAGQTVRQDFELTSQSRYGSETSAVTLAPFTVAATREIDAAILANSEQRYAANIKNVIAADAFGDVSEGNISEFIKRLPGVSVIYPTGGDAVTISVRGLNPESTPITVDGAAMPSASYSATGGARGTNTEQISMSDVARVEVIKSPVPSMPADFLGGSVNLISKSSFERAKPQLTVRGTVQFTDKDYTLGKTAGPTSYRTRKLRPGFDLSYVNPLTKDFGFTLSAMSSNQFGRALGPRTTWQFTPSQGGTETNPFFQSVRTTGDSRETLRDAYGAGVDWRPFPSLTLKVGYRRGTYDLLATAGNRLTISTGSLPTSHGPDFTQGRAGAGSLAHSFAWTGKEGATDHYSFSGKFRPRDWLIDWAASLGKSRNTYAVMPRGFFFGVTTRIVSPTVRMQGFHGTDMPDVADVRSATGAPIDWKDLSNYQIVSVSSDERYGTDGILQGQLNIRRELRLGENHGAVQVGGSVNQRTINQERWTPSWTFVGADGIAGNADNTAAPFVDRVNVGISQKFNTPTDIQWPSPRALYTLYQTNPNYFVLGEPASFISKAIGSQWIRQTLSAAYLQGELKLFHDRLSLLGGVRFERTANLGRGLLVDRNAIYQRDARGQLLRDARGALIPITTNALEQAKLQYQPRGARTSQSYAGYHPSVNATFRLRPELLLRSSYARTIGRPDFTNIIPSVDIQEDASGLPTGRITARNPQLKPWTANSYEVSAEYYFSSTGVLSAAVFRKDVANAFGSKVTILTPELLSQFNLDSTYEGWDLVSTFNVGTATRINGMELNWRQSLTFLPAWAQGLSAFANLTKLEIDGAGFGNLPTKTANWGVSYSRGRVGLGLNWNYQGSYSIPLASVGPKGVDYFKPFVSLDVNSEYRITRRFSVFFNARNITNALAEEDRFSPLTPSYSRQFTNAERGVKMSAGIKGTF